MVRFTDQSTGTPPLSYAWDFNNDGTIDSTIRNPSHTYSTVGTFSVNHIVTNVAGNDSELKRNYITVNPALFHRLQLSPVIPCPGTSPLIVSFSDTSTNSPTAWSWSFRNVTGNNTQVVFSTIKNPRHTFGTGNYSIVLDASNSAGHGISTQVTFINVTSVPDVKAETGVYRPGVGFYLKMDNGNTWNPSTDVYLSWDNSASRSPSSRRLEWGWANRDRCVSPRSRVLSEDGQWEHLESVDRCIPVVG